MESEYEVYLQPCCKRMFYVVVFHLVVQKPRSLQTRKFKVFSTKRIVCITHKVQQFYLCMLCTYELVIS